ncbi:hypothetical protein [Paenibacillus sp. FJAT-26967]|uniref:hypothetical protein n=1 Tax=Paenibacillus sp. FJAT-26967 TaxID=1729690 RepID=UPI000AC3615C|nr:hypothetical protein [Paenibacillus sp. FJAT-26967]
MLVPNRATIGIWLDSKAADKRWRYGLNVFELYLKEILAHAGIPYVMLGDREALEKAKPDILLIAVSGESNIELEQLKHYVKDGGILISYAGLNRMAGALQCREVVCREPVYVTPPHLNTVAGGRKLRALQAKPWVRVDRREGSSEGGYLFKGSPDGEQIAAAYLEFELGAGKLIRWNVNIPGTVVGLQQGERPVIEDGVPAPDGTGALDEGILKADDGCMLDWALDREFTGTGMPYYALPHADLWREVLVSQVLREAASMGRLLPFVDYWPDHTEQVAMISLDSDFNHDDSALAALELLEEMDVRATWCLIEPGYSKPVYEQVAAAGHELAFHYNALAQERGKWEQAEFNRQLDEIRCATGARITANKNHYTRFEGWGELFRWCEDAGIVNDQSRGPSKKGNLGFLFGTCHPYFPIAWSDERNRMYRVLETGYLTPDLAYPSLADTSVIFPLLNRVQEVRGVAHFLFHPIHILQKPKVRAALQQVIREAKTLGYEFWTSEDLYRWEQARRSMLSDDGKLHLEKAPEGAVVWVPVTGAGGKAVTGVEEAAHGSTELPMLREASGVGPETAMRFGVLCRRL